MLKVGSLHFSGRHLSTNVESSVRSKWKSVSITTCSNLARLKNRINTSGGAIVWLFRRICKILGGVWSGSGRRERKEQKDCNKPRRPLLEPMRTHHMEPCVCIQAWAARPIADLGTYAYA
ncbi:hypothetical protein PIB30_015534 [Stylosanthes scabra]|uniref:Uncharacterized protein n=1 Tax=Stylosanthes scabra TaxID=79078 RepID=A0ABU6Z4L5_9FABA|nr:hypothetical protein [Stylosanthes scabra]